MAKTEMNWAAIDADPRFQALNRKKTKFLWTLMSISMVYYFLLPIGTAYYSDLFKIKVWGSVNVGLVFALSQFIVAWVIAWIYAQRANSEFDPMAQAIINDAHNIK